MDSHKQITVTDHRFCAAAKEKKVEATNLDKSVSSSSSSGSPTGRKNGARKQSYSEGLFAVIDSMCEKTNLFEKQWTELQSLITDSEKSLRLAEKIRDLYTTVDQKAGKKRQELQGRMATSSSVGEKGTFKDLQKSLALTARKIYECAEDVPDEEKCRRAAEFVEEVLSEFKRMHFPALAFLQRCFLYACPKLWSDREAVIAAVQQDGLALQMAPGELKNNREVVIAAVRNNSLARQFASNELLSDVEVEMAVHDNDVQSLENSPEWFFTNTLQSNDMRFAIDIHRNHVDLCNSTSLAELLDKSSNLEQAHPFLFPGWGGSFFVGTNFKRPMVLHAPQSEKSQMLLEFCLVDLSIFRADRNSATHSNNVET